MKKSRLKLLGLIAVFAGPLVAASLMYAARDHLPIPAPKSNGALIQPARPLAAFALDTPAGKPLSREDLHGRWTLVYVGGDCALPCQASLYKMRQVRLALGKDTERVQRVYVLTQRQALPALEPLLAEHPGLKLALATDAQAEAAFRLEGERAPHAIYLLDPIGNLMMRFDEHIAAKGLLKDLKKLLRASRIG